MSRAKSPALQPLAASTIGLRAIAAFEAGKGLLVLLLAFGFLQLFHDGDGEEAARTLLIHLHLRPEHRISGAILRAMASVTDAQMWGIAAAALSYAAVRFTEAWGLWRDRTWAKWFSLLSGVMYLPWEFLEWAEHRTWLHSALILGNLIIVIYMLYRVRSGPSRAPHT